MDSIVRLSALFCIFFAIKTTLAAENGYIYETIVNIACKDPSSAKSPCSSVLDYKIPESSNNSIIPDFSYLASGIRNKTQILINSSAGEQCSKGGEKYLCQEAYPFRCYDEYFEVDRDELLTSCNESRKNCSSITEEIRDAFFNCSTIASNPNYQHKILRKLNCEVFPALNNDPYPCDANYKVYAEDTTHLKIYSEDLVLHHKMLKNASLSDEMCKKNVADAICKASIPACSKDQTKVVFILSKQDCRNIMGCINKTKDENLIEGAHGICDELPDGNAAEPYPLDNVYENTKTPTVIPTTSPTTAIPTTSPTTAIPSTSPASRATCQAKELNTRLTGMIFFAMSIFSVCMW